VTTYTCSARPAFSTIAFSSSLRVLFLSFLLRLPFIHSCLPHIHTFLCTILEEERVPFFGDLLVQYCTCSSLTSSWRRGGVSLPVAVTPPCDQLVAHDSPALGDSGIHSVLSPYRDSGRTLTQFGGTIDILGQLVVRLNDKREGPIKYVVQELP
jgi:hypothetical protein